MDEAAQAVAGEGPPRTAEQQADRRRGTWFGVLLGLALLAAGAGLWMLGAPPERVGARLLGPNQPVNRGAMQQTDITANNSPTLARNPVDPRNLVVSNRIDLPRFSCALHASFDAAANWERIDVPFPAGEEDPPRCYAPDVVYAPDGTLHMSFVTLRGNGNVPSAVWVVTSKDGGRTLSTPVKAAGPLAFQVQLTADPADSNRLYLSWLQAEATGTLLFPNTGNPIVTSTSIDAGATWSAPVEVSSPSRERVVAPAAATGPKGELYVLYLDLLDDRLDYGGAHEGRGGAPHEGKWALVLARSTDRGATWEETLVDAEIVPTERFIVFLPPTPSLAVDPESGRIYAAFTDGRLGDPDVHLWVSADAGRTFGPPVRVNDNPRGDGTSQYLPRLDVAPGGRLDVLYFDRRADPGNFFNEVSIQSSFDQGRTFTDRAPVSDKRFDSRVGPGSERGLPDLGNRLALLSTAGRALAVWPDTRGGSEVTSKQDLASAVVDVPEPVASRSWLRVAGGLVAALGLISLLLALRSMRSPAAAGRASTHGGTGPGRKPRAEGAAADEPGGGPPDLVDRPVPGSPDAQVPDEPAPAPTAAAPPTSFPTPAAAAPARSFPVPTADAPPTPGSAPAPTVPPTPVPAPTGAPALDVPPQTAEPALNDEDAPRASPDPTSAPGRDRGVKLFVKEPGLPPTVAPDQSGSGRARPSSAGPPAPPPIPTPTRPGPPPQVATPAAAAERAQPTGPATGTGPERPGGAGGAGPERRGGAGGAGPERPGGAGGAGPERPGGVGGAGPERPVGVGGAGPERPVGVGGAGPERPVGAGDTGPDTGSAGEPPSAPLLGDRPPSVHGPAGPQPGPTGGAGPPKPGSGSGSSPSDPRDRTPPAGGRPDPLPAPSGPGEPAASAAPRAASWSPAPKPDEPAGTRSAPPVPQPTSSESAPPAAVTPPPPEPASSETRAAPARTSIWASTPDRPSDGTPVGREGPPPSADDGTEHDEPDVSRPGSPG